MKLEGRNLNPKIKIWLKYFKQIGTQHRKSSGHWSQLRVIIPREEQGIKEFDDKEFLTRKTDKENKEFTSIKKAL